MSWDTLFVGIDVSKSSNVACFVISDEHIPLPKFVFENSQGGAERLVNKILEVMAEVKVIKLRIGMEATAFFHYHLLNFLVQSTVLQPYKPQVYAINPRIIKNFKKSYPLRGKNDTYDALMIAERLRLGRGLPPPYEVDDMYQPLQRLTRYRFHLIGSLIREKNYFLNMLFLKFSTYHNSDFSNPFGTASLSLINDFFSTDEIAAMPLEELAVFLAEKGRYKFESPIDLAVQIQKIARDAYRLKPNMASSVNTILELSMNNIRFFEQSVNKINNTIEREMRPIFNPLISIPGIGPVLSAGIISEIGDISRFADQSKLAKFAGLTWNEHQSGDFTADETPLNRSGNSYLRYYLIQSADQLRRHTSEYQAFYAKKYNEARTHAHKRALVLTARKFVRLIYTLLSTNKIYQPPRT
ncbi:MAG: IS110 family transposase [Bacillota bacterium]